MKLSIFTFLFTCCLFLNAFGQKGTPHLELSETITTETKNITGFEKIDVSEDFKVIVRFSDEEEKVEIEANENLHDYIVVERVGSTLKIFTKSYNTGNYNGYRSADERLVAYITAKNLNEIKGYEDVDIVFKDAFTTSELKIILDEDCTLKADLKVENLMVDLNEDSTLDIKGSAENMDIKAHEDSIIKSYDFVVDEDLVVHLSDESEAELTVNGDIKLKATEESTFSYRGEGRFLKKQVRGESEVNAPNRSSGDW